MAATGKVIGTVTAVVGEAKATAADGTVRILQVGDKVYSDEAITTSEAGSINVALEGGKTLACDGGAELALHESLLQLANAPAASDVDAIQRAIAAGQDPSQVAAATAAGGAPAAGGSDVDGGSHEPVILEQSNAASVVTSGFETEGDSFAFTAPEIESLLAVVIDDFAPVPADENQQAPSPVLPVFESPASVGQVSTPAPVLEHPAFELPVVAALPETAPVIAVSDAPAADDSNEAPQPQLIVELPAFEPVGDDDGGLDGSPVVVPTETNEEPQAFETPQPPVVIPQADEIPLIETAEEEQDAQPPVTESTEETPVADEQPADEEVPSDPVVAIEDTPPSNDEPVVVETSEEEQDAQPPVIVEQTEEPVEVIPAEDTSSNEPESSSPVTSSIGYTISANTNQDEQIGFLTFSNNGGTFKTLVFFGQEGQQKPTAVQLSFSLDHDEPLVVQLEYVDAFAGHSDAGTGKTAQKIAIKDFSLDIDGTNVVLAQESDGLNLGTVGNKSQMMATVEVDMHGTPTAADDTAGEWEFGSNALTSGQEIDLLDSGSLNLSGVENLQGSDYDVINLKGTAAQELTLSAEDVLQATNDTLHIVGGKEDSLNLTGDQSQWTIVDGDAAAAGTQASYFGWVQVQHSSGATLLVDPDVNINLMG